MKHAKMQECTCKGPQRQDSPQKKKQKHFDGVLVTAEQELHILGTQRLHGLVVGINSRVNHVRLLLLDEHHSALDRVFDAESRNGAGSRLADAVAAIGRLPFCSRVPPPKETS